jgi:Fic family protein
MTIEQKLLSLLAQFKELGIDRQIDYDKFYLYSIITHSTAIEGSTVTEIENQLLFDEGISAKGRSMAEQLMNLDLKAAYEQSLVFAKKHTDISIEMLKKLSSLVMKNTGTIYNTALGEFSSANGDLRLLNVTAGVGGRSYMNYEKVSSKLAVFCESLNNRRKALSKSNILDYYRLSFDAHYQLVTIHPWADGNGRMARLLMNQLQFEFGIIPTNINKDRKAEYIEALVATRENEDLEFFRRFMFDEHIRNLKLMIQNYQTSIANESIGNYDTISADDGLNDGLNDVLKLSERSENILSLVEKNPGITVEEIANALHISKPTTEREMALLKSKNKLLRVGSKKAGMWKINREKE